jgi:hypothetical protein
VGDIDLEVISTIENSNKFPKTRFWKEKSVEDMVTFGPMAQATVVMMILWHVNAWHSTKTCNIKSNPPYFALTLLIFTCICGWQLGAHFTIIVNGASGGWVGLVWIILLYIIEFLL